MLAWVPRCMLDGSVHTLINVANMEYPNYRGFHPLNSSYFSNSTPRGDFPHVTLPSPFLPIASRPCIESGAATCYFWPFFLRQSKYHVPIYLFVIHYFYIFISEGWWVSIQIFSVVTVLKGCIWVQHVVVGPLLEPYLNMVRDKMWSLMNFCGPCLPPQTSP